MWCKTKQKICSFHIVITNLFIETFFLFVCFLQIRELQRILKIVVNKLSWKHANQTMGLYNTYSISCWVKKISLAL